MVIRGYYYLFCSHSLTILHIPDHLGRQSVSFSHVVSKSPPMLESLAAVLTRDTLLTGGHVLHLHVSHRVVLQSHHLSAHRAGKPTLHLLYITRDRI